jgi:two-component system, LytTR family, response regulator
MSEKMRCIIVDDEPLALEGMELKVQKMGFLELVGQFSGGLEANEFLAKNQVDLIFLDIQMPDLTGIELLHSLVRPPMIIFTTAYPEFAIVGYQFSAVGYLLKPIETKQFIATTNKAYELWKSKRTETKTVVETENAPDFIYLRVERQYVKVHLNDIRYIEGMKNYAMVFTLKERLITAISLQQIMEQLPEYVFGRINKSFIVNTKYVQRINAENVVLDTGLELPVGKAFYDAFVERFVKGSLVERR